MNGINCEHIGIIHSPFQEKFGIPRQSGLIPQARGHIELLPPFNQPEALRGLEDFSHLWLLWLAKSEPGRRWKTTVRPPRLGGNTRVGVFASRSIFRPNPIGQSLVRLEGIVSDAAGVHIEVSGLDILDGSPVLDLKPYLPWSDAPPPDQPFEAGYAASPPDPVLEVEFTGNLREQLRHADAKLPELIEVVLALDPRPAFHQPGRVYHMVVSNHEIRFVVEESRATVLSVTPKS